MAKHNPPLLCALCALANALQSIKMFLVWMVGETDKKTDRMANVETACHAGKDKFTKNVSVGETFLGNCWNRTVVSMEKVLHHHLRVSRLVVKNITFGSHMVANRVRILTRAVLASTCLPPQHEGKPEYP